MIVLDASVLTNALTDDGDWGDGARRELSTDPHWSAPEHLVVETFSAIRGRWRGRKIHDRRAIDAVAALGEAHIELLPTTQLLSRMWELRHNLTGYDAAYVALAEAYGCVFITADRRLSEAPDIRAEVRLALG